MGLFKDINSKMDDYLKKTNAILNSTGTISKDIRAFLNSSISDDLDSVKSSINDLKSKVDDISEQCDEDILDDIKTSISNIETELKDKTESINYLKEKYSVIKTDVESLKDAISKWVKDSSMIFDHTVNLVAKAKAEGCR